MKSLLKLNIVILFLATFIGLTACNSGGSNVSGTGSGSTPRSPTVSLTSPNLTSNANDSATPPITLTFSEAVSGVNKKTIQLQSPDGKQETITIKKSGNNYTLNPSQSLLHSTPYIVIVNSGIQSVATGLSVVPTQFNFTVAPGPTVSLTSPTPTTNVDVNTPITLKFSEAVSGVNTNNILFLSRSGQPQSITITQSGNSYTLTPGGSLLYGTQYLVLVKSGIQSVATTQPVLPTKFDFTTATGPLAPTVNLTSPTPTTNTSESPTITLTFSEAVYGVNTNTIQFLSQGGQPQSIDIESLPNNSYTLAPGRFLLYATQYFVLVKSGIKSVNTGLSVVPTQFNFTTSSTSPLAPTVELTSPTPTTNVIESPTITLTFSEPVYGVNTNTVQFQSQGGLPQSIDIKQSTTNPKSYTLNTGGPLLYGTQYLVLVNNGIQSVATGLSVVPTQFNFTTAKQTVNPTVILTSPTPTDNVNVNTPITLTFSEAVSGVTTSTLQLESKGGQPQTITITPLGDYSYTLYTGGPLLPATQYFVLVNSGISSVSTGAPVAPTTFSFTTAAGPTVSLTSPTPTTNVSVTTPITLAFSEAVSGVTTNTLQLESKGGQPQTITITQSGNSYTLNTGGSLLTATQYFVLVNSGISSVGTGAPVTPTTFNFTTTPYQKLYSFAGVTDGSNPYAGLILGSDGNLYGTTSQGGAGKGYGTVFYVTPQGTKTTLYSFGGGAGGAYPYAGLVQGSDGNFYGTTYQGGANNLGTIFYVTPQGTKTTLYSFGGGEATPPDGASPRATLIQTSDGTLYGSTQYGGANKLGTVFQLTLTPQVQETVLWSFAGLPTDGENPYSGLIKATDGNLYGTTYLGGIGVGTVFKLTPGAVPAETVLYSFGGGVDGAFARAGLIQASDGNFYGTTVGNEGNGSGYGTVFKITPQGVKTILYSFTGGNDGASPYGELLQGKDGNLYGTTYAGGSSGNNGTIFKVTPQGVKTTLYSFAGGNDGASPRATLVQASDGTLYGTTQYGGGNNSGTVFKIVPPLN